MTILSVARLATVVAVSLVVVGCGGGGGGGGSGSNTEPDKPVGTLPPAKNSPPTIAGSPATTATVGSPYTFQASATDPEGDPIQFEISNKPAWATFDASTGRLSGTPADADVGAFSNIVISASDGKASVSLAPFGITVAQVQLGAATLTWLPPTENTDGTPIDDLAGFRIRYGRDPGELTKVVSVPNPGITTAVVENLETGVWYFTVSAYNRTGIESENSNLAQKTVL
jgi:hypothetical protein